MYLFFDTETTGLPINWNAPVTNTENWPRIVQLGILVYDYSEKLIEQRDYIIRPDGFVIPKESSKIHGITQEKAISEGHQLLDVLNDFSDLVAKSDYLIAHNFSFDSKVIASEFVRNDLPIITNKKSFCTMINTVNYCKIRNNFGYKWPTLMELHQKVFKKDFENAHNALDDIKATAKCFFELKRMGVITI